MTRTAARRALPFAVPPGRVMRVLALGLLIASVLAGCTSTGTQTPAASGGMGMSGGPTPGPEMGLGVVAGKGEATIEIAKESSSARGVQVVSVRSPEAGWLVVVSLDAPGGILGRMRVPAGDSSDLVVPLDTVDASRVRVRLHADAGSTGVFEYDPNRPERSPDKPVFVSGDPIEGDIRLTLYGVEAPQNLGQIRVSDQKLAADGRLLVDYVRLPGPSWVAVHVMEDGVPGPLVGWLARGAGESFAFGVPLEGAKPGDTLMVTVHVDRGELAEFEYEVSAPLTSIDQPYTANGLIVAQNVTLE